jgi:hypothetical protein
MNTPPLQADDGKSRLDDILETLYHSYNGATGGSYAKSDAKQQIKDLFNELIESSRLKEVDFSGREMQDSNLLSYKKLKRLVEDL